MVGSRSSTSSTSCRWRSIYDHYLEWKNFNAIAQEKQPFGLVWDGQIYDLDLFVIPKGSKNKEAALDFIRFSTDTKRLADQASWIPYGPLRNSSIPLIGTFHSDPSIKMIDHMPTTEVH